MASHQPKLATALLCFENPYDLEDDNDKCRFQKDLPTTKKDALFVAASNEAEMCFYEEFGGGTMASILFCENMFEEQEVPGTPCLTSHDEMNFNFDNENEQATFERSVSNDFEVPLFSSWTTNIRKHKTSNYDNSAILVSSSHDISSPGYEGDGEVPCIYVECSDLPSLSDDDAPNSTEIMTSKTCIYNQESACHLHTRSTSDPAIVPSIDEESNDSQVSFTSSQDYMVHDVSQSSQSSSGSEFRRDLDSCAIDFQIVPEFIEE